MDLKKALFLNKTNYLEVNLGDNKTNWLDIIARYLDDDFKIVQINQGVFLDIEFLNLAKKIRQLVSIYSALLIIKSRADICYLSAADGIILDNSSIKIDDSKKIIKNETLIGLNCNNFESGYDFYTSENEFKTDKPLFIKEKNIDNITIYKAI